MQGTHATPPNPPHPRQLRLLVCVHSGPGYWWSGQGSSSSFIEQRDSEAPSHRWAIKAGLSAHSADKLFAAPAAHKGPCLFAIVVLLAFLCEETKFVSADDAAASFAPRRRLCGDSAAAYFKCLPCGGRIGINHRAEAQITGTVCSQHPQQCGLGCWGQSLIRRTLFPHSGGCCWPCTEIANAICQFIAAVCDARVCLITDVTSSGPQPDFSF